MRSSMEIAYIILKGAAVAVAAAASFTDLKTRKIPNKLTFSAMLAGLVLNLVLFGFKGLTGSFLGILMGFAAFIFFAIGALKAGDVKLYMAIGAYTGWRFCGYAIVYSILVGGVAAFIFMLMRKSGRTALKNLKNYFVNMFYTRRFYMYQPQEASSYFSFGCCILVGVIVTWLLGK